MLAYKRHIDPKGLMGPWEETEVQYNAPLHYFLGWERVEQIEILGRDGNRFQYRAEKPEE